MCKKIKNIIFDFNGTLLDDTDLCFDIETEMQLSEKINPVLTKEEYFNLFGFPVRDYYTVIGFEDAKYPQLATYFMDQYNLRWAKETKLYINCEETLKTLKQKGYKLYVLSATETNFLNEQLKSLGIFNYFDGTIGSDNISATEKISYGRAYIEKNNINPLETVMIGDTLHDYETSEKIGLKCLLYSAGHNSKKRLLTTGCPVVDNYIEIKDYILNN